jgi:hypothetical protein
MHFFQSFHHIEKVKAVIRETNFLQVESRGIHRNCHFVDKADHYLKH